MNDKLVILQLCFNVLMFVALAVLAWRSRPATRAAAAPRPRKAAANTPAPPRMFAPAAVPPALDDLVERADRQEELAAESALRARMAAFRGRANAS